jgi:hypothetical protein
MVILLGQNAIGRKNASVFPQPQGAIQDLQLLLLWSAVENFSTKANGF